jgi:hypothetical protein
LRIDYRDHVAEPRAQVRRQPRADRDAVVAGFEIAEIADQHVRCQPGDVVRRVAADEDGLDPTVEGDQQGLLDQRRRLHHAIGLAHFGEDSFPILEPVVVALDDRVAVEPGDLVDQFGAEAVHHAHHDHQHRHAEHDHADRDRGDERDHRLAAPGKHVALGDSPFERGEDQGCRFAAAVVGAV